MKRISILFSLLMFLLGCHAFGQHSCCTMSASKDDAFLLDKDFIASHLSPMPISFIPTKGKMITFKTPDGTDANAFRVDADKVSTNYLFLFHEWWGLNDYIKQEAEKISTSLGITVIALDLYDGKVTTVPDEASKLFAGLKEDRARAIISGAIDYVGKESQIQTMGWCMGGKWSLQAALMAGPNAKGCVMYYGMPETDPTRLQKLMCPVVGIFASKDKWINAEVVGQFKKDMAAAKKQLFLYTYDANHAFANPSNPDFDKKSTEDAMTKSLTFLKQNIK